MFDGREFLSPGFGRLASAVTIGDDGRIAFTHGRAPPLAGVRWAFQSYPTLVARDSIPAVLRSGGCALDGGISAQLMLRTIDASVLRWPGIRAVPLALVALPWDGVRH